MPDQTGPRPQCKCPKTSGCGHNSLDDQHAHEIQGRVRVIGTQMAEGYVPPSTSLTPPPEPLSLPDQAMPIARTIAGQNADRPDEPDKATLRLPVRLAPGRLGTVMDADHAMIARACDREHGQLIVDALNTSDAEWVRERISTEIERLRALLGHLEETARPGETHPAAPRSAPETPMPRPDVPDAVVAALTRAIDAGHAEVYMSGGGKIEFTDTGFQAWCLAETAEIERRVREQTLRKAADLLDAQPLHCEAHGNVTCTQCPVGSEWLRLEADRIATGEAR